MGYNSRDCSGNLASVLAALVPSCLFSGYSLLISYCALARCNEQVVSPFQVSLPTVVPFSVQPLMALESPAVDTPPHIPVSALLRKHLAHRDAKFAELKEPLFIREDRVLTSESYLAKLASIEVTVYSQVKAVQTDSVAARTDITASKSSVALAVFKYDKHRADCWRSTI